jgi:hypothetical protein
MNVNYHGLYPQEWITFDMYFASLAAMQVHPGAGTKGTKKMSLEQCKDMALDMLKIRRSLSVHGQPNLEEVPLCRGE